MEEMKIQSLGVVSTWPSGKPTETSASFDVEEFAILSTGERVSLHSDRGWTTGMLHRRFSKRPAVLGLCDCRWGAQRYSLHSPARGGR